jgi:hypothetical protein
MTTPPPLDWAVTTATERAVTDAHGRAEITFTVTNLKDLPARVVLTVTTDVDETRTWFTVTDPVRTIDGGASAPFVVKIQVPAGATATTYTFAATVQAADGAPDDQVSVSNRVLLTVTPRPRIQRRPWPASRLIILAAAVLVIAVVVTTVLVLVRPSAPPVALDPSTPAPTRSDLVPVPDVIGQTDVEAVRALISEHGLTPVVRYRFDAVGGRVSGQQPRPNDLAAPGDIVAITFDVAISAPTDVTLSRRVQPQGLTLPYSQAHTRNIVDVTVSWSQAESVVRSWQVMFFSSICYVEENGSVATMGPLATGIAIAHMKQVRVTRVHTPRPPLPYQPYNCNQDPEFVHVAAVDDFGNLGPLSSAQVVSS